MISVNRSLSRMLFFFFFNDTATTEIYTLSLHDALPIFIVRLEGEGFLEASGRGKTLRRHVGDPGALLDWLATVPSARRVRERLDVSLYARSEEHTSELQSRSDLVCRLLLEKKKKSHIAP